MLLGSRSRSLQSYISFRHKNETWRRCRSARWGRRIARKEVQATFVELGTFTANLMHEDSDRVVQISISLNYQILNWKKKLRPTALKSSIT